MINCKSIATGANVYKAYAEFWQIISILGTTKNAIIILQTVFCNKITKAVALFENT